MDLELECPKCSSQIIKSYDGEAKLRAKLIKWGPAGCFAVCKSCTSDVEIKPEVLAELTTKFVYEVKK